MAKPVEHTVDSLRRLGAEIAELDFGYPVEPADFRPGATAADIDALEHALKVELPADYRSFLGECAGMSAADVHNGYFLAPPDRVRVGSHHDGCPQRVRVGDTELHVLVVGSDGGGNHFLLGVGGTTRVWRWDHERPTSDSVVTDEHPALLHLGDSFSDLLRRIEADWRHFLADDQGWSYIV